MLKKNIKFTNFILNKKDKNNKKIFKIYKDVVKEKSEVILSLSKDYKDSFSKKILKNLKKLNNVLLIGMGGSALGAKAIYKFLCPQNKKFTFVDNLSNTLFKDDKKKKINTDYFKIGQYIRNYF